MTITREDDIGTRFKLHMLVFGDVDFICEAFGEVFREIIHAYFMKIYFYTLSNSDYNPHSSYSDSKVRLFVIKI